MAVSPECLKADDRTFDEKLEPIYSWFADVNLRDFKKWINNYFKYKNFTFFFLPHVAKITLQDNFLLIPVVDVWDLLKAKNLNAAFQGCKAIPIWKIKTTQSSYTSSNFLYLAEIYNSIYNIQD